MKCQKLSGTEKKNKCEFSWVPLILAIEARNTDPETKPQVCVAYICVFTTAWGFLCSYLLTNYIIWGWISGLFLTSCKAQHKEQLSCEQTEKCHTVTASSLVSPRQGWVATQGSKYQAQTNSSTVEADQRPQAALEEILSVHSSFWLGRLVFLFCNMWFRQ